MSFFKKKKQPRRLSTPDEFIRRFVVNYSPTISPGLLKHNFLLHKRSVQLISYACAMSPSFLICKRILRYHSQNSWKRLYQTRSLGVASGVSELWHSGTIATTRCTKHRIDVFIWRRFRNPYRLLPLLPVVLHLWDVIWQRPDQPVTYWD